MFQESTSCRQCSRAYLHTHLYCKSVITSWHIAMYSLFIVIMTNKDSCWGSVVWVQVLKALESAMFKGNVRKYFTRSTGTFGHSSVFLHRGLKKLWDRCCEMDRNMSGITKEKKSGGLVFRLSSSLWIYPSGFLFLRSYISVSQEPLCIIASRVLFA